MSERSDFDDAVLDDCRRVDADRARARRDRMARLFSRDEPYSEPDDDDTALATLLADPDLHDTDTVFCVDCGMKGRRDAAGQLPPCWTDQGAGLIRCVRDSERGL